MEQNIYTTYIFKDRNNSQLIQQLTVRNTVDHNDRIKKMIQELKEKYCLSENDILIE
ncbi:hypothetical protein [Rubrolithibacter danxiaensis]|uniref:hypothetical protein n=1 Tax=Rubrolithibacter danxiaensis TaxID=3390805 RepID=UPI003BF854C3